MFAIAESEENYDSQSNGSIMIDNVNNYASNQAINYIIA